MTSSRPNQKRSRGSHARELIAVTVELGVKVFKL